MAEVKVTMDKKNKQFLEYIMQEYRNIAKEEVMKVMEDVASKKDVVEAMEQSRGFAEKVIVASKRMEKDYKRKFVEQGKQIEQIARKTEEAMEQSSALSNQVTATGNQIKKDYTSKFIN